MEQAQYWLWMKRKQLLKSQLPASMKSISGSWEEKAFAEDSSGHLGGCIWPPRSYSCSFCNREFRSAQALGGHMNVHRRDRARLKQSLSPHNYVFQHQNHIQSSLKPLGSHFPSDQVCTLDNYDLDPKLSVSRATNIASTLSSYRVSTLSNQENLSEHAFVYPPSSSFNGPIVPLCTVQLGGRCSVRQAFLAVFPYFSFVPSFLSTLSSS